jgi:hypothetical protein
MQMAAKHDDWHPDLNASDLGGYLTGMSATKLWWNQPVPEAEDDGVYCLLMRCRSYVLIETSSYG